MFPVTDKIAGLFEIFSTVHYYNSTLTLFYCDQKKKKKKSSGNQVKLNFSTNGIFHISVNKYLTSMLEFTERLYSIILIYFVYSRTFFEEFSTEKKFPSNV